MQHVYYPGLPSHPQHELAKRQMRGFGGMLAFELGSLEAARRLLNARPAARAGREPRRRRNADLASGDDDARVGARRSGARRIGITDGLVRISAGIEDIDDLKEDLAQALDRGLSCASDRLRSSTSTSTCSSSSRDYGSWVYAILFAIVFAETGFVVTPFLPGDSLLFAAGALCATGALSTPAAARRCWSLAAFAGNAVNYAVGRLIGPRVFTRTIDRLCTGC